MNSSSAHHIGSRGTGKGSAIMHRDSNDLKELRDVTFKKILRFEEILNSREDQTKRDQSRGDHTKIDPKSTDYIFKVSGMSNRRLFDQKCAEFGSAQLFLIQLYEQTIIDFWQSLTSKLLKQLGANELRIIESMTKLVLPRGQSSGSIKININTRLKIINILKEKIGDPFDLMVPLSIKNS